MIILINYDLRKPGQDYTKLIEKIESLGSSYVRPCESCWLVATTKSVSTVFETLRPYTDENDYILVSQFSEQSYAGWLQSHIWEWIRTQTSALAYR